MKEVNDVEYPKDKLYFDYVKTTKRVSISMNTVLVYMDLERVKKAIAILEEIKSDMENAS